MQTNTETTKAPEAEGHDIAGSTARNYINSPITPLFILVGFVIGIIGIMMTPRQEDPQISVPIVDIFIEYPGASNKQVEALVSEPLERVLKEIKGLEHVYSASGRGQAIITAQFVVGEGMEESILKVYNKLASNLSLMPEGASYPAVKPKGADDVPLVTFTMSSKELDSSQLRLLGYDVLQSIAGVDSAAQGFVVGGDPTEIKVEIDPEKLAGYNISLTQVGRAIRSANAESVAGELSAWQQKYLVYTGDFLKSAEDVNDLIVGVKDKAPVFVRDIATVTEGARDTKNLVNYYTGHANKNGYDSIDGETAITVALSKQGGANGVSVAVDAIAKLESLKGTIIPSNVNVVVTRNYGKTANDKVNNLIFKLFIATGSVTILIWLFLGWRAAVVVSVVIPIVILTTVFAAWMMDLTIDRVSLFALIFSIGILVDDAVVVLENIYRRWLMSGSTDTEVTVNAVSEVGNPTIIATVAVVAALMPMAFVSGMMGPYMAPIPALGSVAMVISLFAAFAFTPWLAQRLKPSMKKLKESEDKEHAQNEKIENFFRTLLGSLVVEKGKGWGFLIGIFVAFGAAAYLVYSTMVPVKLLPFDNKPDFSVVINMPEGTDLPVTANLTHLLVKELQENIPEITTMEAYVGTAAPFDFNGLVRHYYLRDFAWNADIQVHLTDGKERTRPSHEIAESIRHQLDKIARAEGGRIQIVEMPPGPPVLQSIVAEVYGPDEATRSELTRKLTNVFEEAKMVVDVDNFLTAPHDTWRFEINKQKAMEGGISVSSINETIQMALGGYKLGDVKQGFKRGEPTFIVLQTPESIRAEFARIGQIPVSSIMGGTVPLNELGHFVIERQQTTLFHKDLKPVQYVTATGEGRLGAPIYGMLEIQALIDQKPEFNGLTGNYVVVPDSNTESGMIWAGEWTVTYLTFRDMGLAFAIALLVIYMLVVYEFKSFLIPLIVMAPIPLTIIGIAPGHWLMGAEFTATSMIGFIALAGIIVRNSILLVDFTRKEVAEGAEITDAVVAACKARTRPIVITAAALVLGSSVILFDPIFQGMAVSLIFGILVATALTLIVIPLGCISGKKAFEMYRVNTNDDMIPATPQVTQAITVNSVQTVTTVKTSIDPFKNDAYTTSKAEPKAVKKVEVEEPITDTKKATTEEVPTAKKSDVTESKKEDVATDASLDAPKESDTTETTTKSTPAKKAPAKKKRGIKLKDLDDE